MLVLSGLLTGACASRGPGLDRMNEETLFQYGMQQLQEREWSDAITAFERFTQTYPNHPRAAEARYRLAEAFMGRREYVTAAMEFNRLATEFPAGPWADDARFGVCQAYFELSPSPPRDQEYTATAVDHCRSLVTYYPDSDFLPRAREMLDELVDKLAQKEYDNAEYYFRRRAYHSANIYYQWVVDNFTATEWAPRALLRLHESYTRLGYEQEAQAARERLLREFPASPEARQVNGVTAATGP